MQGKTQKPTPKKLRDAGKKGQVWRSANLSTLLLLAGTTVAISGFVTVEGPFDALFDAAQRGFDLSVQGFAAALWRVLALETAPVFLTAIAFGTVSKLLLSRFQLVQDPVKFDLSRLNVAEGFKRLFSMRVLKNALGALVYMATMGLGGMVFWGHHAREVLGLAEATPAGVVAALPHLLSGLVWTLLASVVPLVAIDALLEYRLYMRELMMSHDDIKRENKELAGEPQVRNERRRLRDEFLSDKLKENVEQSSFMLANPTHVAVGIYLNPELTPLPFVSVREAEGRALMVLAHARQCGVPVVHDVKLARRIFDEYRRYTLVTGDCLEGIVEVIQWLTDVERSRQADYENALSGALPQTREMQDGQAADGPAD